MAPKFVAGFTVTSGTVTATAPILYRSLIGVSEEAALHICKQRDWQVEPVDKW